MGGTPDRYGEHPPVRQAPRRMSFALRSELTRMTQEMLRTNVIQESGSPWSSPVVLVKKKDGILRFCVDYRRLNAATRKDVFPMPRIDDLLDQLYGKEIFTTLDAKTGYWQIPMQALSREKTAFVTYNGLYEFRVMPFGLCNAPATFQHLTQRIFSELVQRNLPFICFMAEMRAYPRIQLSHSHGPHIKLT